MGMANSSWGARIMSNGQTFQLVQFNSQWSEKQKALDETHFAST